MTDGSKNSGFVVCGAASRADQVVTGRARDSSIGFARTLASALAARTSKFHVCVQPAAGLVQKQGLMHTQKLSANGYGSQC